MNSYQMTKVNSALGLKQPFASVLSPRQKELIVKIGSKLKADRNSLSEFVSPTDDNKLGAYAAKLEKALSE